MSHDDRMVLCARCGRAMDSLCSECAEDQRIERAAKATSEDVSAVLVRLEMVLERLLEKAEKGGAK